MQKRSFFKFFPTGICLIAATVVPMSLFVSCDAEKAEPGPSPESASAVENGAVSAPETASSTNASAATAVPSSNAESATAVPSSNAEPATAAGSRDCVVYPSEDRSGDEPVIYTERVYYDGKSTPATEKVVYLRAPANAGDVVIPDGVTELVPSALSFNPDLESVVIPDSVGSIPVNAFADCEKLRSVKLPSGISDIPECAFANCRELKEIAIPDGVGTIGPGAFAGCRKLERVSLPANLKTIMHGAFAYCSALKEIAIPEGVKEIADDAFHGCPCEGSVRELKESRGIGAPQPKEN